MVIIQSVTLGSGFLTHFPVVSRFLISPHNHDTGQSFSDLQSYSAAEVYLHSLLSFDILTQSKFSSVHFQVLILAYYSLPQWF